MINNGINVNNSNQFLYSNKILNIIYYKPMFPINHYVPILNNYKLNSLFNIHYQPVKTTEKSYTDSRFYESNYTSNRKNIWKYN